MSDAETTFASGLLHVLEPLAAQYDSHIRSIQLSQASLASQIDSLHQVLAQCAQDSSSFVDVQPYLTKLALTRKKIMHTASVLNTVNDRLNRLNRLARNKYPELAELYERDRLERLKQQQEQQPEQQQQEQLQSTSDMTVITEPLDEQQQSTTTATDQ